MSSRKLGLIFGLIGISVHLLANFGPLILGKITGSMDLMILSNLSLSFNISRILIYFTIGFIIGIILGASINYFRKEKQSNQETL